MPTLADLDQPPRSRTRDLLIGAAVGLPVVALFAWLTLPSLVATIVGEAGEFDERLRQEDSYMQALCSPGVLDLARDEELCECVLAVEFPALDCRDPFLQWSLDRHREACSDRGTRRAALSFCACVEAIGEQVDEAEDEDEARAQALGVARCLELQDAFPLPAIDTLAAGGETGA